MNIVKATANVMRWNQVARIVPFNRSGGRRSLLLLLLIHPILAVFPSGVAAHSSLRLLPRTYFQPCSKELSQGRRNNAEGNGFSERDQRVCASVCHAREAEGSHGQHFWKYFGQDHPTYGSKYLTMSIRTDQFAKGEAEGEPLWSSVAISTDGGTLIKDNSE